MNNLTVIDPLRISVADRECFINTGTPFFRKKTGLIACGTGRIFYTTEDDLLGDVCFLTAETMHVDVMGIDKSALVIIIGNSASSDFFFLISQKSNNTI